VAASAEMTANAEMTVYARIAANAKMNVQILKWILIPSYSLRAATNPTSPFHLVVVP
jgi:hypothetical protein